MQVVISPVDKNCMGRKPDTVCRRQLLMTTLIPNKAQNVMHNAQESMFHNMLSNACSETCSLGCLLWSWSQHKTFWVNTQKIRMCYTSQYCKCISWLRQNSGGLTCSHRKLPCRLAAILIDKACLMFRPRCERFSVSNLGRIPPALHGSTLNTIFCASNVPIACVLMSMFATCKIASKV